MKMTTRMLNAQMWTNALNEARRLCFETKGKEGRFISFDAPKWALESIKSRHFKDAYDFLTIMDGSRENAVLNGLGDYFDECWLLTSEYERQKARR